MVGEKVKIIALNCQGLGKEKKRRDIMLNLRNKKYSIVCLIDTHFAKSQERQITNEWGFTTFFSSLVHYLGGLLFFLITILNLRFTRNTMTLMGTYFY